MNVFETYEREPKPTCPMLHVYLSGWNKSYHINVRGITTQC